jgi:hypothetical protein
MNERGAYRPRSGDNQLELHTDPKRVSKQHGRSKIYVRAKGPQGFDAFDLAELTRESLLQWLRSRGGANEWAENTVCVLLGYPPIVPGKLSDV